MVNKYIKTKINSYNTNFYGNKTPIGGKHIHFPVILLDYIVNAQIFRNTIIKRMQRIQRHNKKEKDNE